MRLGRDRKAKGGTRRRCSPHHLWGSCASLSHSDPIVIGPTDKTCREPRILAKVFPTCYVAYLIFVMTVSRACLRAVSSGWSSPRSMTAEPARVSSVTLRNAGRLATS